MEVTRFFDILDKLKAEIPSKFDILNAKEGNTWKHYSVEDFYNYANWFSFGLMKMGLEKGDKIATVSENRPEWNFIDMGMSQLGIIHTPIYPTISDDDYTHILSHSESKLIFVSNASLYIRLTEITKKIPQKPEIYTFDQLEGAKNWMEITNLGKSSEDVYMRGKLTNIKNSISKDDIATIIYTSGTTGISKGVMLTHWNFIYQLYQIKKKINLNHEHTNFSFLPLCHVLERIVNYTFLFLGLSIYYAESSEKIAENIKEVKPHVIVTVPRLLERIYDKIVQKGKELDGPKRNLFFWALDLALKYELNGANGVLYETKLALANKLIFSKWREALGNRMQYIISGGAALQPRLARVFWAAKVKVLEGYGLTETAPVISVNLPDPKDTMFGTAGPILGIEQQVMIAEDGEILFKGPNLMPGYYKSPEKTAEVIDSNGWFHTGDIGELVDGKFLKITDRKKEIFKLSTGKYVMPQLIENVLKESLFIEQAMVVGDNEKYTGALVSPNFEYLHDWASIKKLHYRDNRELISLPVVVERFTEEIAELNKRLGKTQQIKKFQLVCEQWTTDGGELSPTLKLKRRFVAQKYAWRIDQVYDRHKESGK